MSRIVQLALSVLRKSSRMAPLWRSSGQTSVSRKFDRTRREYVHFQPSVSQILYSIPRIILIEAVPYCPNALSALDILIGQIGQLGHPGFADASQIVDELAKHQPASHQYLSTFTLAS